MLVRKRSTELTLLFGISDFRIFVRWMPDTGGSNVPALNDMLSPFGIALGDRVSEGYFSMGDHSMYYASGTSITQFPQTSTSVIIERDLHNLGIEVRQRFYKHSQIIS